MLYQTYFKPLILLINVVKIFGTPLSIFETPMSILQFYRGVPTINLKNI